MSTVFEATVDSFSERNGGNNGTGTAFAREVAPLGLNAEKVVSKRYSLRDENGKAIETWADIVRRVVSHVSKVEKDPAKQRDFYNEMTAVMLAREFIPNTPCLVNAGKPKGQLAACFVLPVDDTLEGIFGAMRDAAARLTGRHDFASFQARGASIRETTRTMHRVEIAETGGEIVIEVEGEAVEIALRRSGG